MRYKLRVQEFMRSHPDFLATVNRPDIPVSCAVQEIICTLENGPAVAYYLGKNPDYAIELAKQELAVALVRIVRLSELLMDGAHRVN